MLQRHIVPCAAYISASRVHGDVTSFYRIRAQKKNGGTAVRNNSRNTLVNVGFNYDSDILMLSHLTVSLRKMYSVLVSCFDILTLNSNLVNLELPKFKVLQI